MLFSLPVSGNEAGAAGGGKVGGDERLSRDGADTEVESHLSDNSFSMDLACCARGKLLIFSSMAKCEIPVVVGTMEHSECS